MIFVDVGTHDGHTLEEVTKSKYDFDVIYGFEPVLQQYQNALERFGNLPNVSLINAGLSDFTGDAEVYGDNNNLGASIYAAKGDTDETIVHLCKMVEASKFIDTLPENETIIMKLNCEGAEIPILNNLVSTGAIHRLANIMIDFDIRKVSGMEHEEQAILDRFNEAGFTKFSLCDDVMHGPTHQKRIANWLSTTGLL